MVTALVALLFALAALAALGGLALLDFRTVPPLASTWALVMTLAAIAVAIFR